MHASQERAESRPVQDDEDGSTLVLVPVGVLVLLFLLALTLDGAATFMAQRQLADACAAAANDAAVVALQLPELYGRSEEVVDPERATAIGHARAEPLVIAWGAPIRVDTSVDGATVSFTFSGDAPVPVRRSRVRVIASCRATSIRR